MLAFSSVFRDGNVLPRKKITQREVKNELNLPHLCIIENVAPTMHWWHALWAIKQSYFPNKSKPFQAVVIFHIQQIPMNAGPSSRVTLRSSELKGLFLKVLCLPVSRNLRHFCLYALHRGVKK